MTMARSRKNKWVWKESDLSDLVAGRDYLWSHSRLPDGSTRIPENWRELLAECDSIRSFGRLTTGVRYDDTITSR
jgi:hypothetical protein